MWLIYAVFAAILWGLNYSIAEKVSEHISLITMLAIEMILGSIISSCIAYFYSFKPDVITLWNNPSLMRLALSQVLIFTLASVFIVISIQNKNATVAGLIELTYPVFTILFTWYFFHQNHISLPIIIGGGFITIGVLIISLA